MKIKSISYLEGLNMRSQCDSSLFDILMQPLNIFLDGWQAENKRGRRQVSDLGVNEGAVVL